MDEGDAGGQLGSLSITIVTGDLHEILAGQSIGSLEMFNLGVRFFLETFQPLEFSLLLGKRFKEMSDHGAERSITLGCFHPGFTIDLVWK